MQTLQELQPGILQGSGYPAWMCILCPILQLSQRLSHRVRPPLGCSSVTVQLSVLSSIFQSPFHSHCLYNILYCNAVLSHWPIVSLRIKVTFLNITLPTHFPCTDAVAKKPDYTTVLFAQVESCAFWSVFP